MRKYKAAILFCRQLILRVACSNNVTFDDPCWKYMTKVHDHVSWWIDLCDDIQFVHVTSLPTGCVRPGSVWARLVWACSSGVHKCEWYGECETIVGKPWIVSGYLYCTSTVVENAHLLFVHTQCMVSADAKLLTIHAGISPAEVFRERIICFRGWWRFIKSIVMSSSAFFLGIKHSHFPIISFRKIDPKSQISQKCPKSIDQLHKFMHCCHQSLIHVILHVWREIHVSNITRYHSECCNLLDRSCWRLGCYCLSKFCTPDLPLWELSWNRYNINQSNQTWYHQLSHHAC